MRQWMQRARKDKDLTMGEVSTRCGISESYYSMIEAGIRQKRLDITLAVKLSEIFDISLEDIIKYEME